MIQLHMAFRLLVKYHILLLIVATIATVIGARFGLRLPLQSDFADLLPQRFISVQALQRVNEQVGGTEHLRVVLETRDFTAGKQFAAMLEPRLLASAYVKFVDYKREIDFYEKNALLFLDTGQLDSLYDAIQSTVETEKQKLNPLLVDDLFGEEPAVDPAKGLAEWEAEYEDALPTEYYTNADSTVLVMRVFPSESGANLSFVRNMVGEVKQIVAAMQRENQGDDIDVSYGGSFQNRLEELKTVQSDILGTAVYGVSGVFLLITLYFRHLLGAFVISLSLLGSLAWTFGVTYLVIGNLNTITGFLFVILFGLGIDYGIHIFARHVEGRRSGLDSEAALEKAVTQTGKAVATTAITTAAAFFALTPMDFKGFSDLGFISGIGILFAFVGMVVVLPALILLTERLGLLRIRPRPTVQPQLMRRPLVYARPLILVATPITLAAVYFFTHVPFEYDFSNLRAMSEQRREVSTKTAGIFTLSESPAIVLADSIGDVDEILVAVREKIRQDTLSPTIKTVRSIFSLIPQDQEQRLERIRDIRQLVADEAEGVLTGEEKERLDKLTGYLQVNEPFSWDDFPSTDKRQFITKNGQIGNFVFIYPSVALRDGRNAMAFRDDVGEITTSSGKIFHAASPNIIIADLLTIMTREGKVAAVLTFTVVFLIVAGGFRSLKAAALVMCPLAVGVIWMGGVMYLVGLKLNFFNVVVFPSVIGIGVDNGVHIYHRYREEGPSSLPFVLRTTGLVIGMTTLTTIVGYSGLIVATHPGLNSIGNLAVIGLTATFVAAVVVLPAILQLLERK